MKGKKLMSLFVALVLVILLFATDTTYAKEKKDNTPKLPEKITIFYEENTSIGYKYYIENLENGKVSNWKSSNPKVLKLSDKEYFETVGVGNANITCTVKKAGKTYKLKMKATVKKVAPFQFIKVDGTDSYKKEEGNISLRVIANSKYKVNWKLKSGWKLAYADYNEVNDYENKKELKNKGEVEVKEKDVYVHIGVNNSKNETYIYTIYLRPRTEMEEFN